MKKTLISFATAAAILLAAGCESEDSLKAGQGANKVVGTFENVKIIDKKQNENGRMSNDYLIMIEKDGQKVQLQTRGEDSFNALQVGNIITVGYNKDFTIQKITFEKLGGNNNENN